MKRILIVAGEASADMHAANLVRAISKLTKEKMEFSGLGGDALIETGLFTPEFYNRDFAVSGLWELAGHVRKIYSALRHFKNMASLGSYDAAVLLDYPDFNIPLARHLTKKGVPVIYYISPQVWVWRGSRAYSLARNSKKILTIFPFEKDFYATKGIEVEYVGHPLLDQILAYQKSSDVEKLKKEFKSKKGEKMIAVLPGSRHGEIKYILPVMEQACRIIKDRLGEKVRFVIPVAPTVNENDIYSRLSASSREMFQLVKGRTYDVYSTADYALVASGTATVEAGLFEIPMTIVYKVSSLSAFLFKHLIRYRDPIGMVNLLLKKEAAREFFQSDAEPKKIADDVIEKLMDPKAYSSMKKELAELKVILYTGESASATAARHVIKEGLK